MPNPATPSKPDTRVFVYSDYSEPAFTGLWSSKKNLLNVSSLMFKASPCVKAGPFDVCPALGVAACKGICKCLASRRKLLGFHYYGCQLKGVCLSSRDE